MVFKLGCVAGFDRVMTRVVGAGRNFVEQESTWC